MSERCCTRFPPSGPAPETAAKSASPDAVHYIISGSYAEPSTMLGSRRRGERVQPWGNREGCHTCRRDRIAADAAH